MSFGTEHFSLKCPLKGGKERDVNRRREVRITKLVVFVCQSWRALKEKETSLSLWSSQPRIPSRPGTISRARSPSSSLAPVKTKKVKTPKKSAKEEQPVVRTSHMTTRHDALVHKGPPFCGHYCDLTASISKAAGLTRRVPYSLCVQLGRALSALLCTNVSLLGPLTAQEDATLVPWLVVY